MRTVQNNLDRHDKLVHGNSRYEIIDLHKTTNKEKCDQYMVTLKTTTHKRKMRLLSKHNEMAQKMIISKNYYLNNDEKI